MKTLLYAAGDPDRLAPLTEEIPSPMLPVLDRPAMLYAIELLKRQDIQEIDVCLYQKPGEIEAYFGDGRRWGVRLNYHLLREPLVDGSAVRRIFSQLEETLLFLPADILIDLDIQAAALFHQAQGSALTVVAIDPVPHVDLNGSAPLPGERILSVHDEISGPTWIMPTGVFLLEPQAFDQIPANQNIAIFSDLWQKLLAVNMPVSVYQHCGYWNGLYSFEAYLNAQMELLRASGLPDDSAKDASELQFISRHGREIGQGVWCGQKTLIHSSVQIAAPVYICENSRISKGARLGPQVVIGRNVVVDQAATLSNAMILDHTYVGQLVDVDQKIVAKNLVIDIQSGEHVRITDRFLLDKNQPEQVDSSFRRLTHRLTAALILLLFSPLLLALSLLIVLDKMPLMSPVFRLHTSQPEDNARDLLYKQIKLFRLSTRRPDGTQTIIGRLLEQNELHRLPELINVVRGELGLVGVKPLREGEIAQLKEEWQFTRFAAPAGFTGLWYINRNESLEDVLISDVYYAAMRDWRSDARILLQTPGAWLRNTQVKLRLSADSGGVN